MFLRFIQVDECACMLSCVPLSHLGSPYWCIHWPFKFHYYIISHCMDQHFIFSSSHVHMGYFQYFTIINNTAMDLPRHVLWYTFQSFSRNVSKSGIPGLEVHTHLQLYQMMQKCLLMEGLIYQFMISLTVYEFLLLHIPISNNCQIL